MWFDLWLGVTSVEGLSCMELGRAYLCAQTPGTQSAYVCHTELWLFRYSVPVCIFVCTHMYICVCVCVLC